MALETTRFLIADTDTPSLPIEGVTIRIFDDSNTFVTSGITDASGIVDISLDGSAAGVDYTARLYKFGVSFTTPQAFVVYSPPIGAGNNFKAYGDIHAADAPLDSRLCRCHGYLRKANGDPYQGSIRFRLYSPTIVDQTAIFSTEVTATADSSGYISIDLFRTGQYVAVVEQMSDEDRRLYIPDQSTVNIADLLFPIVIEITYDPVAPFSVAAGSTLEVTPTIKATDGRTLGGVALQDIQWSVDDVSVASVSTAETTTLVIRGVANGSTSLRATRRDESISRIPATLTGGTASIVVT